MGAISRLWAALRSLTENVLALAGTVAEVNTGLRQRLQLDGPEPDVIDHEPAPEPGALPAPRKNSKALKA